MNLDDAVVARITKEGKHFEVLVDCDSAMDYRKGLDLELRDIVYVEQVFTDSKKGTKASETDMKNIFGSDDTYVVAGKIIREGKVAVTAEYLRNERAIKRKQIVDLIARNSMNPKTNAPHPPARIDSVLDEAKVKIDENKNAEAQIKEIISQINAILPIKYGSLKMELKVPAQYAGKIQGMLRQYADILSDNWEQDGSWRVKVDLPSGMIEKFETELNNITKGEVQTKKIE